MSWKFSPFTLTLDYYKDSYSIVNHTIDTILSLSDLKKVHIMDVSGGDRIFTLPLSNANYLGYWVKLMRNGTANKLTIQASGADVIWNSSAGGYIECDDTHDYCSINLVMVTIGQWTTPEFGIWSSY